MNMIKWLRVQVYSAELKVNRRETNGQKKPVKHNKRESERKRAERKLSSNNHPDHEYISKNAIHICMNVICEIAFVAAFGFYSYRFFVLVMCRT